MGRCEKADAEESDQKADHRRLHSKSGDSRPRSCLAKHTRPIPTTLALAVHNDVRSSRPLSRPLRALLAHPLQMVQAHRKLVRQPIRLPQSRPRLR